MIEKYPYTDFNEYNLDWVIVRIKELTEEWTTYKTSMDADWNSMKADLTELKDYITSYFDNLDVQEEVNNKIDEMVDDGSLLALLQEPVETATAETAAAWLNEHVTQETGYVLDTSLTIAGAAADARATGLAVAPLKEIVESLTNIDQFLDRENAYISSSTWEYTTFDGYDTYKIPVKAFNIYQFTWDNVDWGSFPYHSIFVIEKNDSTKERLASYKTYGAFYAGGFETEAIVCGVANVKNIYMCIPHGSVNNIKLYVNEPKIRLVNDVIADRTLSEQNSIRSIYYTGYNAFGIFTSPYGSYYLSLKQNDKITLNKIVPGVATKGFSIAADGTSTGIETDSYTAEEDCIICIYDNSTVSGDFTYLPANALQISSRNIIGDIEDNDFYGLNGVAFGTSLTYLASVGNGYLTKLSELSGINFDNQGIGSAYIYGDGGQYDILAKIKSYTGYSGKLIAILEGFVNDWYGNRPLGEYTDSTETSVCGCVRSALNYMMSQNANLTIFLVLDHFGKNTAINCSSTAKNASGLTQYEFYEEIARVANSLGIPVIKEYELSQISENTPQYLTDNIHPTAKGAIQSANTIWSKIKQFYPNEV